MSLRFAACLSLAVAAGLPASVSAGPSNSLMDLTPDGSRLLVANTDNGTRHRGGHGDEQGPARDRRRRQAGGRDLDRQRSPRRRHRLPRGPRRLRRYRHGARSSRSSACPTSHTASSPRRTARRVYVTHEYPGTVSEIDVAKRKVLREMKAGSHGARPRPQSRREAAVRHRVLQRRPARAGPAQRRQSSIAGRATPPTTCRATSSSIRVGPRRTCRTSARTSTSSTAAARSFRT